MLGVLMLVIVSGILGGKDMVKVKEFKKKKKLKWMIRSKSV